MKPILKSSLNFKAADNYEANVNEFDYNKWLYNQLKEYHLEPFDDCCDGDYVPPALVNSDTRLHNPHIFQNTLSFDLYNVITNTTITQNFISIPLSSLNIVTTLVDNENNSITYTNELGITTTISVGGSQTPFVANDSSTIDFTTSGTDNHTLVGHVKISGDVLNDISVDDSGIFLDVTDKETQTKLNALTLVGKILSVNYTGEDGVMQTQPIDFSPIINTTLAVNNQTGTTYTTLSTDSGNIITLTNSSPITVTLTSLTSGTITTFIQAGSGQVTFVNGSHVAGLTKIAGLNGVVRVTSVSGVYYLSGDMS